MVFFLLYLLHLYQLYVPTTFFQFQNFHFKLPSEDQLIKNDRSHKQDYYLPTNNTEFEKNRSLLYFLSIHKNIISQNYLC